MRIGKVFKHIKHGPKVVTNIPFETIISEREIAAKPLLLDTKFQPKGYDEGKWWTNQVFESDPHQGWARIEKQAGRQISYTSRKHIVICLALTYNLSHSM